MENKENKQVPDGKVKIKFEWNDLRALITVLNVVLIMVYGLTVAWFGLAIAILGLIKDLTEIKKENFRLNGVVIHLANLALNIFFLCQL